MNAIKRQQIYNIAAKLVNEISNLQIILDEGREAFDNIPEGLQQSDRNQEASEKLDDLESIIGDLESAVAALENL